MATDRILWNYRPDEREPCGDIDEIVLHDVMVHVEQMDENSWWIGAYKGGADDPYWMGNFTCTAGVMSFSQQENHGIEWDRDDSHEERDEPENPEAAPCIACGKKLFNTFHDTVNQPSQGTIFRSSGNYGSTVWDPMTSSTELVINICDECLKTHAEKVIKRTRHERAGYTYEHWDPEHDDS